MQSDIRLANAGPDDFGPNDVASISALSERVELHNDCPINAPVAHVMQRARVAPLPYRHATQSAAPGLVQAFGVPVAARALGAAAPRVWAGEA